MFSENTRVKLVTFRLTPDQLEMLREATKRLGYASVSEMVRRLILSSIAPDFVDEAKRCVDGYREVISKIGEIEEKLQRLLPPARVESVEPSGGERSGDAPGGN